MRLNISIPYVPPETVVIVQPVEHNGKVGYVWVPIAREMLSADIRLGPVLLEMLDAAVEELIKKDE